MKDISVYILLLLLVFLIFLSSFFSIAETGMMSLNRYRLRHLMREGNRAAKRATDLLKRPDRLLGTILIGNTFANILASAIATFISVRFFGEIGIVFATMLITFIVLIFAEITPKTIAAIYPERIAFLVSLPLKYLLKVLYPLVWIGNGISNSFLKIFGVNVQRSVLEPLSYEELRTIVYEARGKISDSYQKMLLSILDLNKLTVDDVMVPRNEIVGIDLEESWETILHRMTHSEHTHLPVYRGSLDKTEGILHLRDVLRLLVQSRLDQDNLLRIIDEPYYIPEETPLGVQLINFRRAKRRTGLIVDEYGDIQGLVVLQDILEEIVGEFATELDIVEEEDVKAQPDGSYLVSGSVNVRDLNRTMHWHLPTNGPKTLSGLIIEHVEMIPKTGVSIELAGYPLKVVKVGDNRVKWVRISPRLHHDSEQDKVS